jgi:cytoskeletal protein RodZ
MARPRVPLGLEATRTTLNRAACAEIGRVLAETRVDRKLSAQDVARRLMLSPAQVAALETVQPDAFYGADFYANALRKYAAFLDVPVDSARVLIGPAADEAPLPFKRGQAATPDTSQNAAPIGRLGRAAIAVSLVLAASLAAGWWWLGRNQTEGTTPVAGHESGSPSSPEAVQPAPTVTTDPPAPAAEPGPSQLTETQAAIAAVSDSLSPVVTASEASRSTGAERRWGSVQVAQATWIFVRYADNSTEDQGLGPNTTFVFRAQPVYLAVGASEGTRVTVGGHTIDTSPFVVNGQLRIGKSFLGTFVAAR